MRREIVLLDQHHRQAAAGRIARNAGAVDPSTDDQQVDLLFAHAGQNSLFAPRVCSRVTRAPRI